jgi:hypothetical protein
MGRFRPGESGNKRGRPRGIVDRRTQYRRLFELHAEVLVAKVLELALAGDATALRLCLERIAPPVKVRDEAVDVGVLEGPLSQQGQMILAAMGGGRLTPSEAATMLSALASQTRLVEGDEIEARLQALEERIHEHKTAD